jgi:hypothetical protein
VPEAHVRESGRATSAATRGPAGETQQDRHEHQPHEQRRAARAMPSMIPIPFGGSGPDRANVRNPATITAPAAKITRPELTRPPTIASCGSWLRSLPEQLISRVVPGLWEATSPMEPTEEEAVPSKLRGAAPAVPPGRTLRTGFNATQPAASAASAFDKRNWA